MKEYLVDKILFNENIIENKIKELAEKINKDYFNKELIVISILKGSFIFMSDLIRKIQIPCKIDFMMVSSYENNTESNGNFKILKDINICIKNKDVLIVEDIIDTGITLNRIKKHLYNKSANSVEICTLLDKPSRRKEIINFKYFGFTIPDCFIVGYGIDYAENFRELPYICTLKKECYLKK